MTYYPCVSRGIVETYNMTIIKSSNMQ